MSQISREELISEIIYHTRDVKDHVCYDCGNSMSGSITQFLCFRVVCHECYGERHLRLAVSPNTTSPRCRLLTDDS